MKILKLKTVKLKSRILPLVLLLFIGLINITIAQDTSSTQTQRNELKILSLQGNTKSLLTGSASFDFSYDDKAAVKGNFNSVGFSPIFLWKLSDRLFFESEVEIAIDGGETGVDLEYAKFSYRINKYMRLGAGRMLTPFGTYLERLHPTFIERFPNAPLMIHHEDGMHSIGPNGAEMGVDLRGGFQLGAAKMNYAIYVSNGPKLNGDEVGSNPEGTLEYENFYDNNNNKAIGGRIGFLPFSNSSLEIGFSGNRGKVGSVNSIYEKTAATAFAVDVSYVKSISELKSIINIKGQYNSVKVDDASYADASDSTGVGTYTFNNQSNVYYLQFGIHPAFVENNFFKNLEILGRYNSVTLPKEAFWGGGTSTRYDIGLCYWLSWKSGIRFAYENQKSPDGSTSDIFLVRFATGF